MFLGARPSIHALSVNQITSGFVQGTIELNNYNYRANLIYRAQIIKEKLDSLGYPAKIVEYHLKTEIQIDGGHIELQRSATIVQGINSDTRHMLHGVIK
jgi:hypothetical protein